MESSVCKSIMLPWKMMLSTNVKSGRRWTTSLLEQLPNSTSCVSARSIQQFFGSSSSQHFRFFSTAFRTFWFSVYTAARLWKIHHSFISVPPTKIEIEGVKSGSRLSVRENEMVELKCVVHNAKPKALIVWFRENAEFYSGKFLTSLTSSSS